MPNLYLVDDDAAIRDAFSLYASQMGYSVSVFSCAEDFLGIINDHTQGCVILDVRLGGMSGLDLLEIIRTRVLNLACVIITAHGDVHSARKAFLSDAVDFIEKPYDPEALMHAIQQGLRRVNERQRHRQIDQGMSLTPREAQIKTLLLEGFGNKQIAERLEISPRTVEVHKARILEKTGKRSVIDLIRAELPESLGVLESKVANADI